MNHEEPGRLPLPHASVSGSASTSESKTKWGKRDADSGGNGVASRNCTFTAAVRLGAKCYKSRCDPIFCWRNAGKESADAEAQPREFADLLRLNFPLEGTDAAGKGLGDGFEMQVC